MISFDGSQFDLATWRLRPFRGEFLPPPRHGLPASFGDRPFSLEIGAGTGKHALAFARQNPHENLVAIERTSLKSQKASNLLSRKKSEDEAESFSNLSMFQDDAVNWVAHHVKKPCLKGVFILYPNPYPKPSQRNKRFHFMPFMSALVGGMVSGGTLLIVTNEPFYFLEAEYILTRYFGLVRHSHRVCDPRRKPRTNFEAMFFERNILCYEVVFLKV